MPEMARPSGIWFPAKRYGWGWGPPVAWQGWVVLIVWVLLLAGGLLWLLPGGLAGSVLFSLSMVALLMAVCWLKGEPPRWRWGDGRN